MKLEDIGFYTLSDKRAKNVSWISDLQRCELILTDECNFKCSYCRGMKLEHQGSLSFKQAKEVVDIWAAGGLRNIRFSGGEPTIWPNLLKLVKYTKSIETIERIAVSTNGSASLIDYIELLEAGVNDFSISLDACCASKADNMSGTNSNFQHICNVIKYLSKLTYVTVGVVLDDRNNDDLIKIIHYANSLGVSDTRIIPSSQSNHRLDIDVDANTPILKYRINNIKKGKHVRGLSLADSNKCHLVKDDMVVLKNEHFPCVIYMRERGNSIGSVYGKTIDIIRKERKEWFEKKDTLTDEICFKNCLDVCIEHNNKVESFSET